MSAAEREDGVFDVTAVKAETKSSQVSSSSNSASDENDLGEEKDVVGKREEDALGKRKASDEEGKRDGEVKREPEKTKNVNEKQAEEKMEDEYEYDYDEEEENKKEEKEVERKTNNTKDEKKRNAPMKGRNANVDEEEEGSFQDTPFDSRNSTQANTRREEDACGKEEDDGLAEPVNEIVEGLINGDSIKSVEHGMIPYVVAGLADAREERQIRHDVPGSMKIDQLIDDLNAHLRLQMKLFAQQDMKECYSGRLLDAQDSASRLRGSLRRTHRRLQQRKAEKLAQLKKHHKVEEEEFVNKWRSARVMRQYNRASGRLQTMRWQSGMMLRQKRYAELKHHDEQMKSIEDLERNEQYRTMQMEYEKQLTILREKHAEEIRVFEHKEGGQEQAFLSSAAVETERAMRRVQTVEVNVEEVADCDKVWNLHYRHEKRPVTRCMTSMKTNVPPLSRRTVVKNDVVDLGLPPLPDPRRASARGKRFRAQTTVCLRR